MSLKGMPGDVHSPGTRSAATPGSQGPGAPTVHGGGVGAAEIPGAAGGAAGTASTSDSSHITGAVWATSR